MGVQICYDLERNKYPLYSIDDTTIWNVSETTRFVRWNDLSDLEQDLFSHLRNEAMHSTVTKDSLSEGSLFIHYKGPSRPNQQIPIELLVGIITNNQITGNLSISYHSDEDPREKVEVIGFDLNTNYEREISNKRIPGVSLTPSSYENLLQLLQHIPRTRTLPHPCKKEARRYELDYLSLVQNLRDMELEEIENGIFRMNGNENGKENGKESSSSSIVAVHPYYIDYHNTNGHRRKLSPKSIHSLMESYDHLFQLHQGPLVIVEEEERISQTANRLKSIGRKQTTYFVPTQNVDSSIFPYTEDEEFMIFLSTLGTLGMKFVGGHDSGSIPYSYFDPLKMKTITYSGCLRGLAHRLENRGFPKIEVIPEYIYS